MHIVDWLLIISFPVCWGIGAWLFWKWDLGGYRSEHESRRTKRVPDVTCATIGWHDWQKGICLRCGEREYNPSRG